MKMIRQVLTVLGLTGMLFSMTACGKQTKTEAPEASYIASFFDIPDTVAYISRLLIIQLICAALKKVVSPIWRP